MTEAALGLKSHCPPRLDEDINIAYRAVAHLDFSAFRRAVGQGTAWNQRQC
jgi:hypothetical protein